MPVKNACPLGEIETWIFDLDNTLYPASCRLFDQIHARMTRFIADRLDLTPEAALTVQKAYFREHGTTLRGLMTVDRIDPDDFLAFVHEVDLSCVPQDPVLVSALSALPGRKIVHTNGSRRHAERLLDHLGIAMSFCGIIDITVADYEPKPALAGYHELLRRHAGDDHGLGPQPGRLGRRGLGGRSHPPCRRRSRPLSERCLPRRETERRLKPPLP